MPTSHPAKTIANFIFWRWLLIALACIALPAQADIVVERTRIIYPESRRDISFSLLNVSTSEAAIAQMWTDNGDSDSNLDPDKIATPFQLSPVLVRISANGRQMVRLTFTGEPQNPEQESLYWFNVLELPSAYKGPSDADRITLGRRTRVKIFFRPKGLKGDLQQAMKKLQCGLTNADQAWWLECDNPSNFHLSFLGFSMGNSTGIRTVSEDGNMLKPRERARFLVKDFDQLRQPLSSLVFDFINDFGGTAAVTVQLTTP